MSAETVLGLKCRLCGKQYPKEALNFCTDDFGPLEVTYDYDEVARTLSRAAIAARPKSMWRYHELLPLDGEPTVGRQVGCTPLIRADRLARALGVSELYIKNDAVNYPDALVQRPRRRGGTLQGRRARLPDRRLRLHGQSRQQRRRQRRLRRPRGLRLDPQQSRARQGPGRHDLRRQGHRHRGQLRPGEPPLLANRLSSSAGDSSTSTSGRFTPKVPRPSASRSPKTWAGACPTMSSRRWPAAA